jgi:hypothetical protein
VGSDVMYFGANPLIYLRMSKRKPLLRNSFLPIIRDTNKLPRSQIVKFLSNLLGRAVIS